MTRLRTILNRYKGKAVKIVKDNVNHPSHYTLSLIHI